jgi:hypothetical protein
MALTFKAIGSQGSRPGWRSHPSSMAESLLQRGFLRYRERTFIRATLAEEMS